MYPPCRTISIVVRFRSAYIYIYIYIYSTGVIHSFFLGGGAAKQQNLKVLLRSFHVICLSHWERREFISIVQLTLPSKWLGWMNEKPVLHRNVFKLQLFHYFLDDIPVLKIIIHWVQRCYVCLTVPIKWHHYTFIKTSLLLIRGLLEKYPTVFFYANTWWIII